MSEFALDVDHSLNGACWVMPQSAQDACDLIMKQHDLPEVIARLLQVRGIKAEEVGSYLNPKLSTDFPDPLSLKGMDEMAEYLAGAVINGRKIAVFGDFDVDGATSTAILVRFFRHLGIDIPFYIPDRLKEGYGPNETALRVLKDKGAEIVLICDCGITAFDVIASGREMGLEICVLDHHEAEDQLPDANHVINPKRKDDESDLDALAACGVVFLACVALNTKLRDKGFYKEKKLDEPPLKEWLDILALGTVCDMVPLIGANRLFVRAGFLQMAKRKNPGIAALLEVGRVSGTPNPYHAGFVIGPRINAGSRIHKADLGAKILCADDPEEAKNIAWTLDDCNEKRKEIQAEMFDHAVNIIEDEKLFENNIVIVGHKDWHPGLSGLVAGRIREKYDKPAAVITYAPGPDSALEGRGSGRSVPGVNMGAAFIDARNEGVLLKGGGHAMAAGFTVDPGKVEELSAFLSSHVEKQLNGKVFVSKTEIDGLISVRGATLDFVKLIQDKLGPFGQENAEPLFALSNVRLHMVRVVGKDHISAQISDWEGGPRLKAVAFRAADTQMGRALLEHAKDQPFHLAGYFKVDSWNGQEKVEIHIQDAAFAIERAQDEKLLA